MKIYLTSLVLISSLLFAAHAMAEVYKTPPSITLTVYSAKLKNHSSNLLQMAETYNNNKEVTKFNLVMSLRAASEESGRAVDTLSMLADIKEELVDSRDRNVLSKYIKIKTAMAFSTGTEGISYINSLLLLIENPALLSEGQQLRGDIQDLLGLLQK